MANKNINERREWVAEILRDKGHYKAKYFKGGDLLFSCSKSAIYEDVIFLLRNGDYTLYPSTKVKKEILKRDNFTCQYCLQKKDKLIIDHVIPSIHGGHGVNYNLVACCCSCNIKRVKNPKLPNNWKILHSINPIYFEEIKKFMKLI